MRGKVTAMAKGKTKMTLEEFNAKEKGIVWVISDFASNLPATIYSESLGVKSSEGCYRSAVWAENSTRLIGEEYLLNAKRSSLEIGLPLGVYNYSSSLGVKGALCQRSLQEEEAAENGETVKLPRYLPLNESIGAVIRSRRSIREMGERPLTMEEISTLLFYADGPSGKFDFNTHNNMPSSESFGDEYVSAVRCAPSGGGLYPVALYFVAINVNGLEKGLYKYLPLTHSIQKIRMFDNQEMEAFNQISSFGVNIENNRIGIAVYYVYSLYENSRKYGDMAMQFAYIEVGEISENMQLIATAMNLAPTDIGGYEKSLTEQFFQLDGLSKHIIHLTLIGSMK
jgi:SagB-type dehydrogenase family enzyme